MWPQLLHTLGSLYEGGAKVDWQAFYRNTNNNMSNNNNTSNNEATARQRVVLPTYPFQRERYWLPEAKAATRSHVIKRADISVASPDLPLLGQRLRLPFSNDIRFEAANSSPRGLKVPKIKIYDSQSSEYHQVFQFFLDHTDEKEKTIQWLKQVVEDLPSRKLFIDAGAGDGGMTAWLSHSFDCTIALEPNEVLRRKLEKKGPQIEVLPDMILQATLPARQASFVLCSHVFYYVHHDAWMANLERLVSWLAADGLLVVALQHHESDCLKMHKHFCGQEFNLTALGERFQHEMPDQYDLLIETIPINIVTKNLNSAYIIAEFMLNLLPIPHLPTRNRVEGYIKQHFCTPEGEFCFSTDQTLLQIRRRSS